jgi:hypothetical protein
MPFLEIFGRQEALNEPRLWAQWVHPGLGQGSTKNATCGPLGGLSIVTEDLTLRLRGAKKCRPKSLVARKTFRV